jgi:hypothetical protein
MDDGVPMSALAAELVGIYRDAPTLEDEEYAAAAIDDLLDALDDDSDDEVLVALLELPETELTAPLVDDVISMLADTGPRVVGRLLDVAVTGIEPAAWRALDALDRMDGDAKADGLYDVLAGRGPDDLRRTAADELVALGHAGASRLQDAFADPWTRELVQAAVEAGAAPRGAAGGPRSDSAGDPAPGSARPPGPDSAGDPAPGSPRPPGPDSAGDPAPGSARPPGPDDDTREAEFRAYLERFERESGA